MQVSVHNPENQGYLIAYKDSSLIVSSAKWVSLWGLADFLSFSDPTAETLRRCIYFIYWNFFLVVWRSDRSLINPDILTSPSEAWSVCRLPSHRVFVFRVRHSPFSGSLSGFCCSISLSWPPVTLSSDLLPLTSAGGEGDVTLSLVSSGVLFSGVAAWRQFFNLPVLQFGLIKDENCVLLVF